MLAKENIHIEENFHVVAEKADGLQHDSLSRPPRQWHRE
jgi:hypothetical protein